MNDPVDMVSTGFLSYKKERSDMKRNKKKIGALLLSGLVCLTLLNGCGSKEKNNFEEGSVKENEHMQTEAKEEKEENVGEFSMEDMEGNVYTQEIFAEHDLTMVNVFTTWCTPCVREIPDLEELHKDMKDQGIQVIGIALDVIDSSGEADQETVAKAKLLAEETGATYPFLIPDAGYLNGRLSAINAVPETFFVDREGNIVGETYSGSRSLEEWKSIVETELKGIGQ